VVHSEQREKPSGWRGGSQLDAEPLVGKRIINKVAAGLEHYTG